MLAAGFSVMGAGAAGALKEVFRHQLVFTATSSVWWPCFGLLIRRPVQPGGVCRLVSPRHHGTVSCGTLLYCILPFHWAPAMSYNLTSALFIAIFLFSSSRIPWRARCLCCAPRLHGYAADLQTQYAPVWALPPRD